MARNKRRIIIISDGTGETAAQMIQAAMVQFTAKEEDVSLSRYKNVRSKNQIEAICNDAAVEANLIVFTIVSPNLRAFLFQKAREKQIPCVDLLGPLLLGLASYFEYEPKLIAGLLHDVNEKYFDRIDAMEYTIAHDDGRELNHLEQADLIILGISRTSKTPLSMYLSHQGWRVANVPIIQGFDLPKEVYQLNPKKVICLTIDCEDLSKIRRARLQRLGQQQGGDYADVERVNAEIEYANEIFRKNKRWPVFNVTHKALEETAAEIIKLMSVRGAAPRQVHAKVLEQRETKHSP